MAHVFTDDDVIQVITHYAVTDPMCHEDYHSIEILLNGNRVVSHGDHYHDKGREKAEGFLAGMLWTTDATPQLSFTDIADADD